MTYCFRIRMRVSDRTQFDTDESELVLDDGVKGVTLASVVSNTSIETAECLCLQGAGYPSSEEAQEAADMWKTALMVGLAGSRVRADFGSRAPRDVDGA